MLVRYVQKVRTRKNTPRKSGEISIASICQALRIDELVDWLEFAHNDPRGLDWIDELRTKRIDPWYAASLSNSEQLELDLLRRLTSRNRIFESYRSQYQFLRNRKTRPSEFQHQTERLDRSLAVQDTLVLVDNELAEQSPTSVSKRSS